MEPSRIAQSIGRPLDRFIRDCSEHLTDKTDHLIQLFRDITLAAKILHVELNKAGLIDLRGNSGHRNTSGDFQQKLDTLAHIRFMRAFTRGGKVCAIVSEEAETHKELNNEGEYIVAIDPLDGSSNIDVNVPVGTIFSIYQRKTHVRNAIQREDILQKGNEQVAAGYLLYGSSTMLVFTLGLGVNGFTYDVNLGEFILSHFDIKTPEEGKIYSINEGYAHSFDSSVGSYISYCKSSHYTARYTGSLVADFHRNMLKGGIYLYPASSNSLDGKLRLTYECNALAYIAEQSGGAASNGTTRILDINPTYIHQKTPLYIGSRRMVDRAIKSD